MYVKISNGQVVKYPYSISELMADHPNVSFPNPTPSDVLADYGVFHVSPVAPPQISYSENLVEGTPVPNDGAYRQSWVVTAKPEAEVQQIKRNLRAAAYRLESDPLFFKAQRGENTIEEWLNSVADIKARYPD